MGLVPLVTGPSSHLASHVGRVDSSLVGNPDAGHNKPLNLAERRWRCTWLRGRRSDNASGVGVEVLADPVGGVVLVTLRNELGCLLAQEPEQQRPPTPAARPCPSGEAQELEPTVLTRGTEPELARLAVQLEESIGASQIFGADVANGRRL